MSNEASPAPTGQPDLSSLPSTVMHPHKSYRRKYRKIMVKFERQMRESGTLFKDQQRIYDISQRIAEQNDQLLSMLLELNSQPQVPGRLRFDLKDSAARNHPLKHEDPEQALERLRTDRHKVFKYDIRQPEYQDYEEALLDTIEFAPQRAYVDLVKGGPLKRSQVDVDDENNPMAGGFLSSRQEDTYLHSLDEFLDGKNPQPRAHTTHSLGNRHAEKSADREREAQLRNPVSVYNWLRRNQPQVFLQDPDHEKPKPSTAAARKSKREPVAAKVKAEPELYDDEGIAIEPNAGKGKRKRDDDGGYRPKGGHARAIKRRKEESGKRSKRASMDISAS